jgi:large subunit ribosomal protein L3
MLAPIHIPSPKKDRHFYRGAMFMQGLFQRAMSDLPKPVKWYPKMKRIGLLAIKKGMTALFDDFGVHHAVTVLQVDNCQVIRTVKHKNENKWVVEVGGGYRSPLRWKKAQRHFFLKAGTHSKKRIAGFYVPSKSVVPVGTTLYAGHFVPGQRVDVQAVSYFPSHLQVRQRVPRCRQEMGI